MRAAGDERDDRFDQCAQHLLVRVAVSCLLVLAVITGIAPADVATTFGRPETAAERKAHQRLTRIEVELEAARQERQALDFTRLRPRLERLVRDCAGTKYVNKALLLLANWHLDWGDPADALPVLRALRESPWGHLKGAGSIARVRVHLRLGQVVKARDLASGLVADIPEFARLLDLVSFHEQLGTRAPRIEGRNLFGGPADPITDGQQPWLLVIFCDLERDSHSRAVAEVLARTADEGFASVLGLIVVSFNPNPLAAVNCLGFMGGRERSDLIWANPNAGGDAERWRQAWRLPVLPVSVLIGPDRRIDTIDPDDGRIQALLGRDRRSPDRNRRRFDWE